MSGWTKLFSSIVTSSIWCQDDSTRIVWIAMLATCDHHGIVEGSVPGFASLARVTIPQMEHALNVLTSPDPHSRTPDFEGRRLAVIPGGWKILNYGAYSAKAQTKEGSYAPYSRKYRAKIRKASESQEIPDPGHQTTLDASNRGQTRQPDVDTDSVRTGRKERAGDYVAKKNPLVDRAALEAECHELVRKVAPAKDEDPTETIRRASDWKGRGYVNPASMPDDRLAHAVATLRREWAALQPAKPVDLHAERGF